MKSLNHIYRYRNQYIKLTSLSFVLILIACGGSGGPHNYSEDTESPSVPAGFTLNVSSSSQIHLTWNASSDNTGVDGYRIYKESGDIITSSSTAYNDNDLEPGTTYCYEISAFDASGNESACSIQSCITTDSIPLSWSISTIDSLGDVGLSTSISGNPVQISYYDSTNNQLKYAYYSSGAWSTPVSLTDVGSISLATTYSDVLTDTLGNIYISFYDAATITNGDLKLISCPATDDCSDPSNWSSVIIDSAGDVGSDISMTIDQLNNIHISYYDSHNGYLKYASCLFGNDCNQSGNWTILTIDSSGDMGQYSSIATDSGSNIHISYYESEDLFMGNLKYATCSMLNDCNVLSNWNTVKIDTSMDVGLYSSIASDALNNIHISYYDFDNENLKYAFCPFTSDCTLASNWNTVTVDSAGDIGDYSSIAIDSGNNVHISYHDFDNDILKYAECNATDNCTQSSSWNTAIVDDASGVGEFSSIASDDNDTIHISYYDSENQDLKYAVKQ